MPHQCRKYELLAFPHLHSNGLGNVYDDDRTVHVPAPEARRHLLGLSIRTLATDPLWLLVNFDNSNKSSAQGLLTVRLSRDQGLANAAFQVTPDELQALAQHQDDSRHTGNTVRIDKSSKKTVSAFIEAMIKKGYGAGNKRDE